jgi:hypothetical protein
MTTLRYEKTPDDVPIAQVSSSDIAIAKLSLVQAQAWQAVEVLLAHGAALPLFQGQSSEEILSWFPSVSSIGRSSREKHVAFMAELHAARVRLAELHTQLWRLIDRLETAPLSALTVRQGVGAGRTSDPGGAGQAEGDKTKRRRGRKPDTDPKADKRVADAWGTGNFKTHEECGRALELTKKQVKDALDRHRKRPGNRRGRAPE